MAGSYLKSLQLAKQLEEKAKEAGRNKEKAEKENDTLQQFLKLCSESDVDLSEVEKPQRDFESSMASKDYQSALAHVREAKEASRSAYIKKIGEVGDSVYSLVNLIQGAGNEAPSAVDLLEKSKERVVAEDLEGAMKLARNAYDAAERTVHELFSQQFSQAQETIMQAKEMGDDVAIFEDQMSSARMALDNQEYEECLAKIKEVLEGAGEDLKTQINSTISRAEELVVAGEELKADMTRVKTHVDKAKTALSGLKFKESLSYAKKAENEGETGIASRFQELTKETRECIKKMKNAKADVSISQQLLDQAQSAMKEKRYIEALHAVTSSHEKVQQMQFQAVLAVMQEARDRFVLARKVGVDMTKAVMFLNTSRDNLNLDRFEEAIDYAEQAKAEVDKSLEQFYKARDHIVELAKAVKTAAEVGADPTRVRSLLADARKQFEAQEYAKTVQFTTQGIADVKKLAYDAAMTSVDVSDKAIKIGKEIGADMTEAEGVLQRAMECIHKEDLAECVSLSRSSKEAANAAMTRVMSDKLQSIDQFVKGYPGEGLPEVPEMITQARQLVASNDFDRAHALLTEVTGKIENIGQAECERLIGTASTKIDTVRSMEGDTSDLEILLTRAKESLSKKVYDDATARSREIIDQANEQIGKLVRAEFSSVKDTMEEAHSLGIDISEPKEAIREAGAMLESQEFGEAFSLTRQSKDHLQQRIAQHERIKGKIRRAEELIAEAERTKSDVTKIVRSLETARNAFSIGSLDQADSQLDDCISAAEKSLGMYLAAKFILSSKENIDLAQAYDMNAVAAAELLGKAKEQMKLKNYDEALSFAKKCDQEARNAIVTSIATMTKDLQRLLADARNVGVDTVGPEKLLEKALELSKEGNLSESLRCIASAKEDINHVKNLSSQAAVEIRVARNNLRDAETLDMDVGRAREFLAQSVEALTRHQYAIALELARKSSEESSDVTKNRIWSTLEKFKDKVERAASEGRYLGMSERFVAEGIEAFKQGKYQESLKLAMKCETEIERAELQRDISSRAVEMANKKLADARSEGIESERLTELVTSASALLKEGKYVDAMTAAIASGDELHSIRENLDSCRIELSTVRERIERLKKVNIDTSESDEILDMAQEYLAGHEFNKCRDALKRGSERSAALFESSIKDVMEQNSQMIAKAKSMGINTKACEDLLEVARTSFSESLWDFAYQQAAACKDSCIALISKKMSNLVAEVEEKAAGLRKHNVSTKVIDDMIGAAKEAADEGDGATAFQTLMEADRKIPLIDEAHKKYLDISIAADSAIENLGRFGLSRREPERLVAMAEIEKDNDYDSAIELLAEALDTAKDRMETYSPDVVATISVAGLQEAVEGVVPLTLKNNGKALAKDISVTISGDFQVVSSPGVQLLKPGSEAKVDLRVIPRKSGGVPIKISVKSARQLDGNTQTVELQDTLTVFPAGPPFKLGRSTETTRCISCQGRIKPGFDILTCRCGGQLHLSCAKRTNTCPVCGQKYNF